LAISQAEQLLSYLDELGLITALIPELNQAKEVEQPKEHFWNVFDHSLKTVVTAGFLLRQGTWEYASGEVLAAAPWSEMLAKHFDLEVSSGSTRRLLVKLAALLHDIAKPQAKAIAKEAKLVEVMVRYHLRPGQMSHDGLPSRRAIYRYFRDTGEAGIDILFLSLADHLATKGPHLKPDHWQKHTQIVEYVLSQRFEQESLVIPPKLVDGHDLINIFGMSPGPEIGEVLEAVREAQASGELATKQEALSYIRERLLSKAV